MAGTGPHDSFADQLSHTRTLEGRFIGHNLAEAARLSGQLGLRLRVVDEQTTAITADLVSNRMTVRLSDGVVVEATAG